ncbi:MAG: DUF1634 domain-containing protein [Elusimicrobia bacterium]|nr:DUF1634 domain-containing protein [Elusimicrobiota bacterium]MDE2237877.1 DUF1634 domain-containing protein [Elusimicrobiota bacterium]MDE2426134.1 DUF1634 domain-containing protein [Elusimicrobiota bacterium]
MKEAERKRGDVEIHQASAWVLRAGVISSVSMMLLGLAISLFKDRPDVARMSSLGFKPDYLNILRQASRGNGLALIELGIFLLVLTPILRVAASMAIFAAHERDWFYAAVTFLVLLLTLASLLILR